MPSGPRIQDRSKSVRSFGQGGLVSCGADHGICPALDRSKSQASQMRISRESGPFNFRGASRRVSRSSCNEHRHQRGTAPVPWGKESEPLVRYVKADSARQRGPSILRRPQRLGLGSTGPAVKLFGYLSDARQHFAREMFEPHGQGSSGPMPLSSQNPRSFFLAPWRSSVIPSGSACCQSAGAVLSCWP